MSHVDPISDMLTRIRNANLVRAAEVRMPHSILKHALAEVLVKEGFLSTAKKNDNEGKPELVLALRYSAERTPAPAINGIKRISKPGQRIYVSKQRVPRVNQGLGIAVLSTPKGLLTDKQARRQGIGGEIICTIW